MAATKAEPFRSMGFAAISWIEHFLVHGPGDVQGQKIELDDELGAFTVKAYQVEPRRGRLTRGGRKVRRAFLSRAKGRNKSGFAAMIECFEALGPCRFDHWAEAGEVSDWGYEYEEGEPVGKPLGYVEILNVATEEGQAGNTYDAVYYMLHPDTASAELKLRYGRLDVGLTRINLPDKRGFIEPVTAANDSADGGKSTFIVADETHLWKLPRLKRMHQTMVRNLLKRKLASGWMLETSTMYAEGEGSVAEGTHAYAKMLKKKGRGDGKLLFDHRQASAHWDLEKRSERIKALKEAYGPAAAWMDLQEIADYWDDPQASHEEFRRFFLNQPVSTEAKVELVMPNWTGCATLAEEPPVEAIGISVSWDRAWGSIGAATKASSGAVDRLPFVGAVLRRRGTGWLVKKAKSIQDETGAIVVVDGRGTASNLIEPLEAAGVRVLTASTEDYLGACADVYDAVDNFELEHGDHDDLNDAVTAASRRKVGKRWAWAGNEIDMLEAATLAKWGADQSVSTEAWGFWE